MKRIICGLIIFLFASTQLFGADSVNNKNYESDNLVNPFVSLNAGYISGVSDILYNLEEDNDDFSRYYDTGKNGCSGFSWGIESGFRFLGTKYKYHPVLYITYEEFYQNTDIIVDTYQKRYPYKHIQETTKTKSKTSFWSIGLDHYIRVGHNDKIFNFDNVTTFINMGLSIGEMKTKFDIKHYNSVSGNGAAFVFKVGLVNQLNNKFGIKTDIRFVDILSMCGVDIGVVYMF